MASFRLSIKRSIFEIAVAIACAVEIGAPSKVDAQFQGGEAAATQPILPSSPSTQPSPDTKTFLNQNACVIGKILKISKTVRQSVPDYNFQITSPDGVRSYATHEVDEKQTYWEANDTIYVKALPGVEIAELYLVRTTQPILSHSRLQGAWTEVSNIDPNDVPVQTPTYYTVYNRTTHTRERRLYIAPVDAYIVRLEPSGTGTIKQSITTRLYHNEIPHFYLACFPKEQVLPIWIQLAQRSSADPDSASNNAPSLTDPTEATARAKLSLADSYKSAHSEDMARELYIAIIRDYPHTASASLVRQRKELTDSEITAATRPASTSIANNVNAAQPTGDDWRIALVVRQLYFNHLATVASQREMDAEAAQARAQRQQAALQANQAQAANNANPNPAQDSGPLDIADQVIQVLENKGIIRTATFVNYFWNRGFNQSTQLPSGENDVGLSFNFEFVTESGLIRQHQGYIAFRRVGLNWVPQFANIDGLGDVSVKALLNGGFIMR